MNTIDIYSMLIGAVIGAVIGCILTRIFDRFFPSKAAKDFNKTAKKIDKTAKEVSEMSEMLNKFISPLQDNSRLESEEIDRKLGQIEEKKDKEEEASSSATIFLAVIISIARLLVAMFSVVRLSAGFLEKLVSRVSAEEQYKEGLLYWRGEGGKKKDRIRAVKLWHASEKQRYAKAQYILAFFYLEGKPPIALDERRGFRLFKKAAKQNHVRAQSALAFCYSVGRGVKQNDKKSYHWWRKPAEKGDAGSQWNVGYLYLLGKGVRRNIKRAEYWTTKAAEQGYLPALNNLGAMYEHEEKIKNLPIAYALYCLAVAGGLPTAQRNTKILKKRMTKEQVLEAQGIFESWQLRIKNKREFDAS